MDFFRRLIGLIPTVRAAEADSFSASIEESLPRGELQDSSEAGAAANPTQKEIDLRTNIESYSDVIVSSNYEGFPERPHNRYRASLWNKLVRFEGREEIERLYCEQTLYEILKEDPLAKLLVGALKTAGCNIDFRRNFSCEVCYSGVYGGYDTDTQQVVLCMNNLGKKYMATIVAHELIHMYDHCVNDTNFTKLEHLVCSEIRAINLTSCSLADSVRSGYVGLTELLTKGYAKKHFICVKERALSSVMAASPGLSEEEARSAIDKVFPHCYADLEPIGRRLRHKTDDNLRAFKDGQHYGYV